MVSSEGLVRGIDRTLEYAEYTEEERPVSIQIFGGDPAKMAAAAQVVESMGADIVDVNMGCPVPKIAKHNAGCSLMREPGHAADVIRAMTGAVKIPVTVKMRAGWNDGSRNAPELARRVRDAGAAAVTIHGRTAEQSYSGRADWDLVAQVADDLGIPVFGSGDCVEPDEILARLRLGVSGVLVGRGVLRNPGSSRRRRRWPGARRRLRSRSSSAASSFVPTSACCSTSGCRRPRLPPSRTRQLDEAARLAPARGRERWVINKVRALCAWYSKGLEGGSILRSRVNTADSLAQLDEMIDEFFAAELPYRSKKRALKRRPRVLLNQAEALSPKASRLLIARPALSRRAHRLEERCCPVRLLPSDTAGDCRRFERTRPPGTSCPPRGTRPGAATAGRGARARASESSTVVMLMPPSRCTRAMPGKSPDASMADTSLVPTTRSRTASAAAEALQRAIGKATRNDVASASRRPASPPRSRGRPRRAAPASRSAPARPESPDGRPRPQ
jgi:tRNA-dihydrouridine synthase